MSDVSRTAAQAIREGFEHYHARFSDITRRARTRFQQHDVAGLRCDLVERIDLYDECIAATDARLRETLGERARDRAL